MSGDKRARLKEWLQSGEARLNPLTFPQRELWEASPVAVADPSNHICCFIKVTGAIVHDDCRTAVQRVVERHEVLRLSFLPGKEKPLQMIRKSGEANIVFRELKPAETSTEAIEELAAEIFREPFDLVQGPLYRVQILSISAEEHVMILGIHHAIADGWSLGIFIRDLCAAYLQERMGLHEPLPEVPLTYTAWGAADRAAWPPEELATRSLFWKAALAGRQRFWPTPSVESPPALKRWVTQLPATPTAAVRELARATGVTLFSTLLSVFQASLSRWTGVDDIVVGTPVANRSKQTVRETMGYFAGNVPLRGVVDKARLFTDALRAVHQNTVDSFAHAMPFAELLQALDEHPAAGYYPIYQVRFALQNHPVPDVKVPSLSAQLRMRSTGTPRFDLGCEITEDGESLEVVWLYRPGFLSFDQVNELNQIFQSTLIAGCRSPESSIKTLLN